MFHRANAGANKPSGKMQVNAVGNDQQQPPRTGMNQTAIRRYQGSEERIHNDDLANQNATTPYAVKKVNETQKQKIMETQIKEDMDMNNPQVKPQQNNQGDQPSQGRVDIPGNNFQRPGIPAGRPAYPGAYPGAASAPAQPVSSQSTSSYNTQAADNQNRLVIGRGITLSGEIEACEHLVVEGTVEASLKGASVLDIAESGAFYGTVEIDEANVAGRFEGDITVNGRLTIEETGVIIGSITYKELAIEAGATIEGSVSPLGSQHTQSQPTSRKSAPAKAKKVSQNNENELPFADKSVAAE
jgi:cytoskeletal protein CcmA (bactofilin family)